MKHLFKVDYHKKHVTLNLCIRLSSQEVASIANVSDDLRAGTPKDLEKGYQEDGLEWLLHLLRVYIYFGNFKSTFAKIKKTRKKKK